MYSAAEQCTVQCRAQSLYYSSVPNEYTAPGVQEHSTRKLVIDASAAKSTCTVLYEFMCINGAVIVLLSRAALLYCSYKNCTALNIAETSISSDSSVLNL